MDRGVVGYGSGYWTGSSELSSAELNNDVSYIRRYIETEADLNQIDPVRENSVLYLAVVENEG